MTEHEFKNRLGELARGISQSALSAREELEIELIMRRLAELQNAPSVLLTKDWQYPTGEEIPASRNNEAPVLERIIGESNLLPVFFLEQGVERQKAVARIVLTQPEGNLNAGSGLATGFMVSPSLFLTNHHVIENSAFLHKIRIQFNYQLGPDGMPRPTESYLPEISGTFHTEPALDYTLIRLRPSQVAGELAGNKFGFIRLNENPTFFSRQNLNIVQHPQGREKEIALQKNEIDKLFENVVRYTSDTEPGSSGSPVFDNLWQLVALHHGAGEQNSAGQYINNEGIRSNRIVEDLRIHFTGTGQTAVLAELGI
jgi:hypothetical protein